MGRNAQNKPETQAPEVNENTTPETQAPETVENTTDKPYVPGKEDAVYKDGTVVIGGKRKESILIPREPGTKHQVDVYAKANENTALIQRGKKVMVPRPLARVVNESIKRGEAADEYYYAKSSD